MTIALSSHRPPENTGKKKRRDDGLALIYTTVCVLKSLKHQAPLRIKVGISVGPLCFWKKFSEKTETA